MALNEQTEMVFGDEPPRRDPVSGNEVPPGALPSEVRDDIPARLSEGEYVVPADVLQYYGIKFFEDLRGKAKNDLAKLDSDGRIGGEAMVSEGDFPFSVEELNSYEDGEPVQANMGGVIKGYQEGGITQMDPLGSQSVLKTYINDAGQRLFIRFVNGVAIPPVPPGYREEGTSITGTTPTTPVVDPFVAMQPGDDETGQEPEIFPRNLDKMNAAQLAQYAAEISKTNTYKTITKHPGIGFLARRQEKKVIDYLENQIKQIDKGNPMTEFYQALLDGIEKGDRDGLEKLVKEIKTNNPELNTKVLVTGSRISKDREKGSTVLDSGTKSNNTKGLGGTKYAPKPIMRPTAQEDAADSGGTTVVKTSEVDPFGIGSTGEFDTSETTSVDTPVTDVDGFLDSAGGDLQPVGPEGVTEPIPLGNLTQEKDKIDTTTTAQQLEAPSTEIRDSLINKVRSKASSVTPLDSLQRIIKNIRSNSITPVKTSQQIRDEVTSGVRPASLYPEFYRPTLGGKGLMGGSPEEEASTIMLLSELNSNPQNATDILSKSNLNLQAQDSAALASNLMSPRLGYESGQDSMQERMVDGLYGARLPLTDSDSTDLKLQNAYDKAIASEEAMSKQIKEMIEDNNKEIARIEQGIEQRKEMTPERIAERVERGRSGRGGFNKGGLATRKKKKKK